MGHGDEIVLADAHFPTSSVCRAKGAKEIRCDGLKIPELLDAILNLFPLDHYVPYPVAIMKVTPNDLVLFALGPPIWKQFREVVGKHSKNEVAFEEMERFAFYERAKNAYVVVHTGELSHYGNIILTKGVIN